MSCVFECLNIQTASLYIFLVLIISILATSIFYAVKKSISRIKAHKIAFYIPLVSILLSAIAIAILIFLLLYVIFPLI